jgi:hypothetical protein
LGNGARHSISGIRRHIGLSLHPIIREGDASNAFPEPRSSMKISCAPPVLHWCKGKFTSARSDRADRLMLIR